MKPKAVPLFTPTPTPAPTPTTPTTPVAVKSIDNKFHNYGVEYCVLLYNRADNSYHHVVLFTSDRFVQRLLKSPSGYYQKRRKFYHANYMHEWHILVSREQLGFDLDATEMELLQKFLAHEVNTNIYSIVSHGFYDVGRVIPVTVVN